MTILRTLLALAAFLLAKAGISMYRKRHPCDGECRVCERLVML